MSASGKIVTGLVMVLLIQWTVFRDLDGQSKRRNRPHTFAPLPALLNAGDLSGEEALRIWEGERRSEVLQLFRDEMYGNTPNHGVKMDARVSYVNKEEMHGQAELKEVEVQLSGDKESHTFTILILLPPDRDGPVPLFLGLNFYGNQTLLEDADISLTKSWVETNRSLGIEGNTATEESRGKRAHRWPADLILSRGYGLATIYAGDIDPDFDDGFKNGVHGLFPGEELNRDPGSWGTLSAWAWGLSRALDYLESDPDVDARRVAVIGHSRMGKAALWAGAQDERFALVISNNSGCGGAALSRRAYGERVDQINTTFPHWFNGRFHTYNNREDELPVDQHMLMALIAPRPLYVASAREDDWADPYGEYLSLYYGSEAFGWYGNQTLPSDRMPEVDQPLRVGRLAYHIRTGKHDLTRFDWEQYLDFADRFLSGGGSDEWVNPVTEQWVREHLNQQAPRLILTTELETEVKARLRQKDPLTMQGYELLSMAAGPILKLEPLIYKKQGRRLLGVSREALRRLTTLALIYRFERDPLYLQRLEEELAGVCAFPDWNPSHFLDVAEMAAGVALAIDWAGEWISSDIAELARKSLIEKALIPALTDTTNTWWVDVHHNWNLVCHGGVALAALAVFEDAPELATRAIHQAVEHIPLALEPYAPSGVYPEGASYWFYATSYLTLAIEAFETALGTGFGFVDAPGLRESALFSQVLAGPSGDYFNYFDASLAGFHSLEHFGLLSWFSIRSGQGVDIQRYEKVLQETANMKGLQGMPRLYPLYFLYTIQLDHTAAPSRLPGVWVGFGEEPVAVMRGSNPGVHGFFLAAKGGRAADNHGNMDAGSFVFELDSVRWSLDPGNQGYFELEQLMGQGLWETSQDSRRWTLLTKSNFGHSTLTINGEPHLVEARSTLVRMDQRDGLPEVVFNLTPVYGDHADKVERTFKQISDRCLRINDRVMFSASTASLTWQMVTTANVRVRNNTIYCRQEGKELALYVLNSEPAAITVVDLDPPPLPYDKKVPGLKRIEITWERESFEDAGAELVVELNNDVYQRR
jgi:hypothetical protein